MFDQRKLSELENKSHVRGKLNKEFFAPEQEELERKRREMKAILDEQVNQRRRQKERQKYEEEKQIREEDQRIKSYYAKVDEREKKITDSRVKQPRKQSGVYESKVSLADKEPYNRYRANSRNKLQAEAGDIPVMPVFEAQNTKPIPNYSNGSHHINASSPPRSNHHNSMGNIPLLELSPEEMKKEQKRRVKSKNPTLKKERETDREKQRQREREREKIRQTERRKEQEKQRDDKDERGIVRERRKTVQEESLPGSRQHTDFKEIFEEINEEIQAENKNLRQQLRKNQEAISLLIGAVKSSAKLDKFRIQAQRILHEGVHPKGRQSRMKKPSTRDGSKEKEKDFMLPPLKLKHQSILHDFMFRSAQKASVMKAKTFK